MSDHLFCNICQMSCNSSEQFILHESGKRHLNKLKVIGQGNITEGNEIGDFNVVRSFDDEASSRVKNTFEHIEPVVSRGKQENVTFNNMSEIETNGNKLKGEAFAISENEIQLNSAQLCEQFDDRNENILRNSPINTGSERNFQSAEATTWSDDGLNILSPRMKMMTSRNEPGLEDCELNEVKHHVTTFQPGGNLPAHGEMTLPPVKEKSPVKFERTVSENLNDKNDKVTPIKDKLMDNPSSRLSSTTDNCQQTSFLPQNVDQERKYYVLGVEKGSCFICEVELKQLEAVNMQSLSALSRFNTPAAIEKIKEILAYGESPIGNIEHSTLKKEFMTPPQTQVSVTNSDPIARGNGFANENKSIASFDQDDLERQGRNDISPNCKTGAFGYQLGTGIRPNTGRDNSDERGNGHSSPNDHGNCSSSSRISSNLYNQPNPTNPGEDEEEDVGNRNIQGEEETQPETQRSQTGETSQSTEVPIASGCKDKYYCDLCEMSTNSKTSLEEHKKGKIHQRKLSNMKAPTSLDQPNPTGETSYGERYQTEDKDESQLSESTGREGLSSFDNVITGYKKSTRGSTRQKGQRGQLNLAQDDDTESSSDEDEEDDVGNRNIQGDEETQPETQRSQTDETSQSFEVPIASEIASGCKDKYYCDLCERSTNSRTTLKEHKKGKYHQRKLSNMKAPTSLDQGIIVKTARPSKEIFDMTKNIPRSYQLKLTEKAMSSDCVVYLPTGTGKTMVSVLTIGLMLEKNPKRPVIFLVDKVLLVIQQAKYIETELKLKDKVFLRAPVEPNDNDDLIERKLNLAFVCQGLLRNNNLPMWQQDIIVTTADYCINMLNNGAIRWNDFSLAVLDEAHHCVKEHPYKKLIKNYHQEITDPKERPKILGLTASPAGKSSVGATYEMLQNLLKSLGGAKIAIVEEDNLKELRTYQSSPRLCQFCVSLTDKDKCFQEQCIKYFLQCYIKLAPLSSTLKNNDEPPCSYFLPALKYPSEESLQNITQNLMIDSAPLSEILPLIFECITSAEGDELSKFKHLRTHTFTILSNIADIHTGINFKELKSAFTESPENNVLHDVKAFGLPWDIFYKQILNFEEEEGNAEPAMIGKLMRILEDPAYVDWRKKDFMALVLVRERKSAKSLSKKLRHKQFISKNKLRVTHLVGHGKRTQGDGMTVKEQHKVLRNQEKYHILVATSIAEEGIDINKLELVISMNPPSNVTALVQMRGRARKKESHFVILCSNEEQMRKLDELKQQEENMMEAAKKCIENE